MRCSLKRWAYMASANTSLSDDGLPLVLGLSLGLPNAEQAFDRQAKKVVLTKRGDFLRPQGKAQGIQR